MSASVLWRIFRSKDITHRRSQRVSQSSMRREGLDEQRKAFARDLRMLIDSAATPVCYYDETTFHNWMVDGRKCWQARG